MVGVRVVETVEVPAAVVGERGQRVGAAADQLPQVFRRADSAGEAAAHADDRDGVVVGDGGTDLRGRAALPGRRGPLGELFAEVAGEFEARGVVEDDRGGGAQAGRQGDAVTQFHGARRGQAEVLEGPAGLDLVDRLVAQHLPQLVADEGEQGAAAFGL